MKTTQYVKQLTRLSSVIILLALLFGCEEKKTSTPVKPQNVSVKQLIKSETYQRALEFTGSIRAANTTEIGFELNGKIKQLLVDGGDIVKKDQALAELDTQLLKAQQQEVVASLLQNSADLTLAKSNLNRNLELQSKGYASTQQLDENQGKVDSLIAARNRLNASLQAIVLKIDKSVLLSPFEASVGQRHRNLGEVINIGSPVFTLIQSNRPQAHIGIPVALSRQFSSAQTLSVIVANTAYQAQVLGLSTQVNPITRTQTLRLALPDNAQVVNGELAYLDYQQRITHTGFWVPISALTQGIRGRWNLYVSQQDEAQAQETKSKHFIAKRDVEIIYTDDYMAYITGAIDDGEYYIDTGLHKLVAGQEILPNIQSASR